ncbi:MAG: SUMF1/EgtB/PvdO family nonheme iron enzyme [Phycisphaerae bacterium]|jgi:formylglycine-generating enzyme required for sulfatase activity|nr:SUMF1/EgtB/PvdO family nonheme iron enzyme [Phycisphaerae bacterium]
MAKNAGWGWFVAVVMSIAATCGQSTAAPASRVDPIKALRSFDIEAVRLAVKDMTATSGVKYPNGSQYLAGLDKLAAARSAMLKPNSPPIRAVAADMLASLRRARREALLGNPLLDFDKLMLLKRRRGQLALPVNHKCNSGLKSGGYDNEIAVLSPVAPSGKLKTLYRPKGGEFVGEIDLHFSAEKLLFTMPTGRAWQVFEIKSSGGGLRQVSRGKNAGVDSFDACYLPDGRIVFASTASWHAVPCWHGQQRACALYQMKADGSAVRQLCFDQDLDLHPAVLPSGQVVFSRWDYTGPMHMYLRPLMVMNPDGTGQRALYGSNSYWPNSLYFPRGIPGSPNKIVAIVSGYHGVPRMGELVLLDLTKGTRRAEGVVQRIPGRGKAIKPIIRDKLVEKSWPKFLHPYPLSDKYFLVAGQRYSKGPWSIYLVDVFDNIIPLFAPRGFDVFEPIPLRKTALPPAIPDKVDLTRDDAVCYVQDIYAGGGLGGVPRGTVERLRIVAYHYGYPGLAGPDKIGSGGPWEVMRILGTVPVYADGSASFKIPAGTPLCVQPLDAEGKAVQLMRSWFAAMPGEVVSCVGCHERSKEAPVPRRDIASKKTPVEIKQWYGPPRGLDFERDVQPAIDKYCVACHDGSEREDGRKILDLRSERLVKGYRGRPLTGLAASRLHPSLRKAWGGTFVRYTPAYEALVPYIRRVNVEDDVEMLTPGQYHADTSELIQILRKGHHKVRLDREAWDRFITWIDLNGPCHGTWGDLGAIPDGADRRRYELSKLYGGPKVDPEKVPPIARAKIKPIEPEEIDELPPAPPEVPGWPFDAIEARRRQKVKGAFERTVDLGGGVTMKLARIPAGEFVMGDSTGQLDERPQLRRKIARDFWMGVFEVTNEQFRRFDTKHNSGRFTKRFVGTDGPGLSLDGAKFPAVRVSWKQADEFCKWLSKKTSMAFTLPTEAQWEYACRAGSAEAFSYGAIDADFSACANLADKALGGRPAPTGGLQSNLTSAGGGDIICDPNFNDRSVATSPVGRYKPNAWWLFDMHGNAAEWTRTTYRPYSTKADDRNAPAVAGRKVLRGGSWVDRPKRCRSGFRLAYPIWQRVHNAGFRVVCKLER